MTNYDKLYMEDTFAGPFDENECELFQKWLIRCGYSKIVFDKSFVTHQRKYHGGCFKQKYFRTQTGETHAAVRLLNFVDSSNCLADYNIESTWSMVSDRMADHLMPFAALAGGDLLCFDHDFSPPRVVIWYHELSEPGGEPKFEFVATNFSEFLGLLSDDF